ncbi:MAG TPA: hypothetical protein VF520_04155 [Thermoleophilaceae bacterium]|jgi:hypothetical protein
MSEETPAKRGEAAYKEQRDAISKRNADTRKRAKAERESRESVVDARLRADARREAEQLRDLNARIEEQRTGAPR